MGELTNVGILAAFGAGVVMIGVGIAMMSGKLTVFSYWLLEKFPALGRIG
jgi:cytochrome c-type biogenesis protein